MGSMFSQALIAYVQTPFSPTMGNSSTTFALPQLDSAKNFTPPSAKQSKTLFQESAPLTTKERRILRQQFEKFIHNKEAKNLTIEELRKAADFCLKLAANEKAWYKKALFYLQHITTVSKDTEQIKALKLEISDIYFELGDLETAGKDFAEYLDLYPGSENAEYAHYKRILCQFYQTYKIDQDQQKTLATESLGNAYLSKTTYKHYCTEIKEILTHCSLMLYNSELNIANFYFKKKNYNAATNRIAHLKKEFITKLPGIEPEILSFECRIAKAQNNTQLYNERIALLEKKFPRFISSTRVAQRAKKSHADRF